MIDARISARFFRAISAVDGAPNFELQLAEAAVPPAPKDRERDIGQGIVVRLERHREVGEFLEGEFSRVQRSGIPPQAGEDGLLPITLRDGHGLAHVAAFIYHKPTQILLLQRNVQSATTNRLGLYLAGADPARLLTFSPLLTEDAVAQFKRGSARRFKVRFANIESLQALNDKGVAVAQGAMMIAEAYHGAQVEITVSMGRDRRRNFLSKDRLDREIDLLADAPGVDALEAKLLDEEAALDILNEQMKVASELQLPENDPSAHYEVRRLFLRQQFDQRLGELRRRYLA